MPPRPPPAAGARGRGRGAPPPRGGAPRGGPPASGRGRGGAPPQLNIAEHVQTIGVRKPGYGREGRPFQVFTNHFAASVTDQTISHYDGASLLWSWPWPPPTVLLVSIAEIPCLSLPIIIQSVCAVIIKRSRSYDSFPSLVILSSEKTLPARLNFEIITTLQVSTLSCTIFAQLPAAYRLIYLSMFPLSRRS